MSGGGQGSSRGSYDPVIQDSFDDSERATAPSQSEKAVIEDDSFDEWLELMPICDDVEIEEEARNDTAVGDSVLEDSFEKSFELVAISDQVEKPRMTSQRPSTSSDDSGICSPISQAIAEDEHAHKLVSVLGNVVQQHMYSANDVNSVVDCFTESTDASTLGEILTMGMCNLVIDENANPRAVAAVCRFLAMVSLRALRQESLVPFSATQEIIETFIERPEGYCRIRACQMIATMLTIGEEADDMEVDDAKVLPSVPVLQWCHHLSTRRMDKDVAVRCAALQAFSRLHIEKFFDHKGKQSSPFLMIASSLNDVSPEVRKAAIQLLPLSSRDAISTAIRFLRNDDETPSLRLQMAERIISEVHVQSFAEKQKIELISQLFHDKDVALRGLLGTRLVGYWLKWLGEEEITEPPKEGEKRLPAHPMALLKQLNRFKDEEIVAVVVKLALSYFMEVAVESRTDGTAYLDFLRTMPKKLRESSGTLHKKSVKAEIREDKPELPQRLFMHRCLLEFLNSLYPLPADLGKKDHILSRLLPNALEMCNLSKEYATKIFDPTEACSKNQLFAFRQIGHLIRTLDLDCPIAKKYYEDTLKELISNNDVAVPLDIIEFAMDEIWVVIVKDDDPEDFVQWAGFTMGGLLDSIPILQSQSAEDLGTSGYSETEYNTFLRVATIMECVLRNPAVTTLSPLIRSAFARIVNPFKAALTEVGRSLGIKVTGLILRLDKSFLAETAVVFRHSMLYDLVPVKVHALRGLTDIIWEYGFDKIAAAAFPEIKDDKLKYREELAILPEQLITHLPPCKELSEMVSDACRLIYKCVWPKLIGAVLFRLFDGDCDTETHQVAELFFTGFVEKGIGAKIEMIAGFMACCKHVEDEFDMATHKFRFGCMMTFLSELFGKAPSTEECKLPNKITIDTVFAINLLRKIGSDPRGTIQPQLACCLGSINVDAIRGKDAKKVLETATAVLRRLVNNNGLGKMRASVERFMKAVKKQVDLTANGQRQNPRRRVAVKMEDFGEDWNYGEGYEEVYSPSISKRLRLCRGSSPGVWSRSEEPGVKQELLSQIVVKEEPLDSYFDEPEAIVIDGEEKKEDDLEVLSLIPPKRRRLQRNTSVVEE